MALLYILTSLIMPNQKVLGVGFLSVPMDTLLVPLVRPGWSPPRVNMLTLHMTGIVWNSARASASSMSDRTRSFHEETDKQ